MNLFFSDTFDTDTATTLPAWLVDIVGTWSVVADSGANSSPNDFQCTSHNDGDKVLLLGGAGVSIPPTADMVLELVTKTFQNQLPQNGIQYIVRSDSVGQNYYVFLMEKASSSSNIAFQLYKCMSGSLTAIGGITDTGYAYPGSGVALRVKVAAIGSSISAKVWQDGTSEPSSYQVSATDSSITAAGYAGFYHAGSIPGFAVDNVQLFGNSSLAAGSLSSSNIAATTLTVTAAAASGGAGPYTYQWYRSTNSSFVPQTSNLVSGATDLTLNDTGLTPNTIYQYVQIATDSTGAINWSSQISVATISTGVLTSGSASLISAGSTVANVTVANASGGTPPYSYQWYRSTTPGFAPSEGNIVSGATSQNLSDIGLSPMTAYYYKNVVTDSTSASSISNQATATTGAALTAGMPFASYVGAKKIQLSANEATGGSGTYALQWYRSTTSGINGLPISGATAESIVDATAVASTDYYYSLQFTDTGGGAQTFSPQVHVRTLTATVEEVIGGIGDSIMMGAFSTFETPFNVMIDQLNYKLTAKQFTGINEAVSGTTSVDWSTTNGGSNLLNAVAAFVSANTTRIVLMLGTNDSKASVATSPSAYQSNIQTVLDYLFANVSTLKSVHLFSSPYQSLSSGDLSVQNCFRLKSYAAALATVANQTTIFCSQPLSSYNLFQNNPSLLRDGIHPTDIGDQAIGALWASGIESDLTTSPAAAGFPRSRVVNE